MIKSLLILYIILIFTSSIANALQCESDNLIYTIKENLTNASLEKFECSAGYITVELSFNGTCPKKAIASLQGFSNITLYPIVEYNATNNTCIAEFTTKGIALLRLDANDNLTLIFLEHGSLVIITSPLQTTTVTPALTPGEHETRSVYTPQEVDESKKHGLTNKMSSWPTPLLETIALVTFAGLTIVAAVKEYEWNKRSHRGHEERNTSTNIR